MSGMDTTGSSPKPFLRFPPSSQALIAPYLPPNANLVSTRHRQTPFLTLTFAQSLDGGISLRPGTQTHLSGPETKAMTHFLRAQHEAILIGAGTAIADNPSLNCRLEGASLQHQPRPVILDPDNLWNPGNSTCFQLAKNGLGLAPWVIVGHAVDSESIEKLSEVGGIYVVMPRENVTSQASGANLRPEIPWSEILPMLRGRGIRSVMVEGGAGVIRKLLRPSNLNFIDSVILTIAPTWLGEGSLVVSPPQIEGDGDGIKALPVRLKETTWHQFGEDVVMCGRVRQDSIGRDSRENTTQAVSANFNVHVAKVTRWLDSNSEPTC